MAARKPFTFTAYSYITDKTGDGKTRCRQQTVFEQVPSPKGTYKFKPIKRTVFMPESEQLAYDKRMMQHAGEVLSDYFSNKIDPAD